MGVNGIISQEDIQQLVTQSLVQNNKTLSLIELRKEREEAAKSDWDAVRTAMTDLETSLMALREPSTFYTPAVSSSDDTIVTAEAGTNAGVTSYDLQNIVLAQAAQKVSAGTLGLSSATSAYYESTASVLDNSNMIFGDNGETISNWNKYETGSVAGATVTEAVFDGKNVYDFNITSSGVKQAILENEFGAGKISDKFTVEASVYVENAGTFPGANNFQINVDTDVFRFDARFSDSGLYIYDSSSTAIEIGTDVVNIGEWSDWKFEVDSTDPNNPSVDVYLNNNLIATGVSAGYSGDFSATDGNITVGQTSYYDPNRAYIDSISVYPTDLTGGLVNENYLLDASEGEHNIGGSITDGSFEINGSTINVDIENDTLMEVLSKINASDAGVTATWNDTEDKIRLTIDEGGSNTIEFGSTDTSGFLAAMNINTSVPTASGVEAGWDRELDQVAALSGVSDGYFNINDITFQVDTSVDSLQDIINEINGSQAGVNAYYQESLDKVVLTSKATGENITFGNDTSNFLTTVFGDLNDATFTQGSVDVNGQTIAIDGNEFEVGDVKFTLHSDSVAGANISVGRDTEGAQAAIEDFIEKFNTARDIIDAKDDGNLSNDRLLRNIENNLRTYVLNDISNPGSYSFLRDVGIEYNRGRLSLNSTALDDAFRLNPDSVGQLFGFDSNSDGTRDDGGFVNIMKFNFLDDITSRYSGDIADRQKLIDSRIEKAENDMTKYEKVIANKEARLWNQYAQFADQVNAMNAQFQTFQAQLQQLNQLTVSLYGSSGGF